MILVNCDDLEVDRFRTYGGATGPKICVKFLGDSYMLKVQQNIRTRGFKNVEISYANDPISEYVGSHFYELCGIPVHRTVLGTYHSKMCVLCRDYAAPNKVIEFREWRNSIMDDGIIQHSSGMSTKICDILQVINNVDVINNDEVKQRFWDMFVIDSIIGNTDRNNGNWGFYIKDNELKLYPVYDCGGCLNNKKSDEQLLKILDNSDDVKHYAYNFTTSYQSSSGKRINPLKHIKENIDNAFIRNAISKLPKSLDSTNDMIDFIIPIISSVRAVWYKSMIRMRYEYILNDCKMGRFKSASDIMSG